MSRFYPCLNCGHGFDEHVQEKPNKCLFGPLQWKPQDYKVAKPSGHIFALKQLDVYKKLLDNELRRFEGEVRRMESALKACDQVKIDIAQACKHIYDDGSSAKKYGSICTQCELCGWNDY